MNYRTDIGRNDDGRGDKIIGISRYGILQRIRVQPKYTPMENAAYAKYYKYIYESDDYEIQERKEKHEAKSK